MAGLTKAKVEVYKIIFEMIMQAILTIFAMIIFSICFYKFFLSNTEFDTKRWVAASGIFAGTIYVIYAFFFKKKDEKKEESKLDKLLNALNSRIAGGNPPSNP